MDTTELTKAFGAFFAVMNPFANLPVFLAMTVGYSAAQQKALAAKITLFSTAMCVVVFVAGQKIIAFFGIGVDQFRVAGGAVLATIAWQMLNGSNVASHQGSKAEQSHMGDLSELAFYPITFPMIVGPGTITTLIVYAGHAKTAPDMVAVVGAVAIILAMMFVVLYFASEIGRHLSESMQVISTRLMGMILLAIAVEMGFAGLRALLPGLAR